MARPKGSKNKAPRKPRAKKDEAPKTQPTAASQPASSQSSAAKQVNAEFKRPTKDQVIKLVKGLESMHIQAKEITSAMGEKVAKAVENQHVDRVALGIARKLWKRFQGNALQGAITLTHLLSYIDDLSLDKEAEQAKAEALNLDGEDDDTEAAAATEDAGGDDAPPDEQPTTGKSPALTVVPGSAAPSSVPPAPTEGEDEEAA